MINATGSFNSKARIADQTDDYGEIDNVEIMVPLKYLRIFGKLLKLFWLGLFCVYLYCESKCYIYNNWNKTLFSSSYFINSR